ncbi:cytochrome c oxidase subunit I [Devosia sp. YIM 151766]|uniref:cytochrome c oxidase subunit I n=1 Tax=Devosia sp. YIM 151766 TaxID=3017325 RepID=UPI00255D0854|nr:cytochrome c oxidase subunit I [Devosia sp. YIM 151766]WIY53361.1 cytochrome c oxidase subunit I [Devosia sp. YIM 151766]
MNEVPSPISLHKQLERIWTTPPGLGRLSSVNHSVLGKRFMVTALVFFAIGGLLSMLIRAQLATPNSAFIGPELYNQIFTMHGTVMMFLFAIPMFEGFIIYMLPKMLGARDMAFPRLTAYGFWCYLFGGMILIGAMLAGAAPNGGWFMYTPLTSKPYTPGINADVWLLGITFVEISAVTAAVEILVSILKMRAPGMSLTRMPLLGWYMLVTSGMMMIGFPPLILGSILLELERAFGLPFFDPNRGGDPLLWQHLFWLFGHPEVYIIFLPGAGVLSTVIPVFAQRPILGYRAIIAAIVALGFLSFGLWVHHMFTVGIPHLALAFFSAASALVAIPTAVQIFAWLGTLASGRPRWDVPMLYIFGFFFVFVIGGLTGVMLAMVPFNSQAHDSYFVVAHLHYVLVGGFVFPMLAGIYYWMPHISGRQSLYRLSVPAFWLIFIGFNLTFFLMHLTGLMGMPRRISTYPSNWGWDWLNLLSSIGGFILAMGFALVLADMVLQFRFGRFFRRDPWKAQTLEWATATPPPPYNFAAIPRIDERADQLEPAKIGPVQAGGFGYLGFARNNDQETMGVDMVTGAPEHVVILPRRTFLPLWTAIATASFFLALLFGLYWLAPLGALATLVLFLFWPLTLGQKRDFGPVEIGMGERAVLDVECTSNVTILANRGALVMNATLFASLLFGGLFLLVVAPNWQDMTPLGLPPWLGIAGLAATMAGAALSWLARRTNARGGAAGGLLGLAAAAQILATGLLIALMAFIPEPTEHARQALIFTTLGYAALHCGFAALMAGHGWWRMQQNYVSAHRQTEMVLTWLWNGYAAGAALPALALTLLLGLAGAAA